MGPFAVLGGNIRGCCPECHPHYSNMPHPHSPHTPAAHTSALSVCKAATCDVTAPLPPLTPTPQALPSSTLCCTLQLCRDTPSACVAAEKMAASVPKAWHYTDVLGPVHRGTDQGLGCYTELKQLKPLLWQLQHDADTTKAVWCQSSPGSLPIPQLMF